MIRLPQIILVLVVFWSLSIASIQQSAAEPSSNRLAVVTTSAESESEDKEDKKEESPEKESGETTDDAPDDSKKATEDAPADSAKSESADDASDDETSDADEEKSPAQESEKKEPESKEKTKSEPEKPKDVEASESKKPKPFVVKRKPLKIEEDLDGVFVAREMTEIALHPEAWSRFTVVECVPHGAEVKKGDVLVRFDDEALNEKLAQDAIEQRLSELSLMRTDEQQPREERLLELAYERAKRAYENLKQDVDYYKEKDRPFAERIAKYRYASAKEDLASQEEELTQLKKMYEADELTEDTEAIVLRRQEFEVDTARLMLELQEANRDYALEVTIPRNDEAYETALERARLELEAAKMELDLGITRGKYELEQKRASRAQSVKSGAELLSDRSLMELEAPCDGTVYYGRCVDGRWSEVNSLSSKLVPRSTVPPNSVLMTVVKQRPLYVLAQLSEKSLTDFSSGMFAVVKPAADEDRELHGKVTKVAGIPGGSRKFDMEVELGSTELPDWLVAGMTCNMTVTTYENQDALQIPVALVNSDKDDEDNKYVMIVTEQSDKPLRRNVKVGREKDKFVEILEGLSVGEKIVPQEKSKEEDEKDSDE